MQRDGSYQNGKSLIIFIAFYIVVQVFRGFFGLIVSYHQKKKQVKDD